MSEYEDAVAAVAREIVERVGGPGLVYHTRRRREKEVRERLTSLIADLSGSDKPWNPSNPDWWKLNVETRGEHAWPWLVNEFAASQGD